MSLEEEENDGALRLGFDDSKKMRPPNKKKFDEDMDGLTSQIKEKEAELEKVRQAIAEIKQFKAQRMECSNRRRQIGTDLERINKEIPDRMKRLNEIEASLYYKNEDKINSAIQRLEWNLSVKTYRLTEEKKIVSEIDSLKRSKKYLVQYLTLKQEISEIRDRQKGLRDGRDTYTKELNRLKSQEDTLKGNNRSLATIKREIDALYEQRRQTNANFKQQRGEFNELKEKHRKESWKKKAEDRKVYEEKTPELPIIRTENEAERLPHESDVQTCLSLTSYLSRLLPPMTHDSLSPASSQDGRELAEELEDGHLKLLRRSDDSDSLDLSQGGGAGGMRRLSKRNKKLKKLAMEKKVSLSPDIVSQLISLDLAVPTCASEVPDVLEQLEAKRSFFEKEQQLCEATSDAGISATESAVCVMSRQASKTESCDGGIQDSGTSSSRPDDSVYTALFQQQQESRGGNGPGTLSANQEELRGAVGGKAEDDDWSSITVGIGSDSPHSDSTIDGDAGSLNPVPAWSNNDALVVVKSRQKAVAENAASERRELKMSLAISISDSTDSSSLVDQSIQSAPYIVEDDFPSLLESSQSSFLSETSFPSLGVSDSGSFNQWQESADTSSNVNKQATLSSSSSKGHLPLTKTYSVVPQHNSLIMHDQQPPQQQQQQLLFPQQAPKAKSYASSVVSRARSFSEVKPKQRQGNYLHRSTDFAGGDRTTTSSKPIQPPSSLSISPAAPMNVWKQLTPTPTTASSSKPKPSSSLHRSRTLTPTLTRTWTEVRDRHRKSSGNSSGSGGGGSSNITTPSGSGRNANTATTPTQSNSNNNHKARSPLSPKAQVSPSLSSSAIPSPHKSSLSPRLSYPLQAKPSLPTPTQPLIIIDNDKNFPPLGPTGTGGGNNNITQSRRNSSLSTKSSTGSTSISIQDRDTSINSSTTTTTTAATTPNAITTATITSDSNNNNSSCSFSYLDVAQGIPPPLPSAHGYSSSNVTTQNIPSNLNSNYHRKLCASSSSVLIPTTPTTTPATTVIDSSLSSLPKGSKSSTEKWVESSMAFVQELSAPEEDDKSRTQVTSL